MLKQQDQEVVLLFQCEKIRHGGQCKKRIEELSK